MKDKFEEAITSEIDKLRFTDNWIAEIADNIKKLHQQAIKEEKKKSLIEGFKMGIDAVTGCIKKINKEL